MYNKTPFNSSPQRFLRIGLPQLSHTASHKNEHYLLLCPSLDNVPTLAFENPKSNEHHFLAVCCILNFILVAICGCCHSIFWRLPCPYCSSSSSSRSVSLTVQSTQSHQLNFRAFIFITSYYMFPGIRISSSVMMRLKKVTFVLLVVQKALAGIQKSAFERVCHLLKNFMKA